jgi:hypothetical protein
LTNAVSPAGWRLDSPAEAPNVHFWEYNSRDLQGNPINDAMRLAVSKRLTKETDAETIANYSNPVWVLGGDWNPRLAPVFSKQQIASVTQYPALFLVGDSLMNTGSGAGEVGP